MVKKMVGKEEEANSREEVKSVLSEEQREKIREETKRLITGIFEKSQSEYEVEEELRRRLDDLIKEYNSPINLEQEMEKYNEFIGGLEAATSIDLDLMKVDKIGNRYEWMLRREEIAEIKRQVLIKIRREREKED